MATIYHYPTSHCSRKVRMVAAELGLPHSLATVDIVTCENYDPAYAKRINPGMVVPSYLDIDKKTVVVDSRAIIEFLVAKYNRTFSDIDLVPPAGEKNTASEWMDRMDALDIVTISMGSGRYLPPYIVYLRQAKGLRLTKLYAARFASSDPPLAKLYRDRRLRLERAASKTRSGESLSFAFERLKADLGDMDALLESDGRSWLCGDRFTIVDAAWAPVFKRLDDIGYTEEALLGLPRVQSYSSALKQRPSYASAIDGFPPPIRSPAKKVRAVCALVYDRLVGGKETTLAVASGVAAAALAFQRSR